MVATDQTVTHHNGRFIVTRNDWSGPTVILGDLTFWAENITELDDWKKFAELIVSECVRYFNEDYQRDFDTTWREDLTKGIKQHFGVKE